MAKKFFFSHSQNGQKIPKNSQKEKKKFPGNSWKFLFFPREKLRKTGWEPSRMHLSSFFSFLFVPFHLFCFPHDMILCASYQYFGVACTNCTKVCLLLVGCLGECPPAPCPQMASLRSAKWTKKRNSREIPIPKNPKKNPGNYSLSPTFEIVWPKKKEKKYSASRETETTFPRPMENQDSGPIVAWSRKPLSVPHTAGNPNKYQTNINVEEYPAVVATAADWNLSICVKFGGMSSNFPFLTWP